MELFWMLTAEGQRDLMMYQFRTYGTHLSIPNRPMGLVGAETDEDEPADREIVALMQKKPHSPRRIE